MTFRNFVVIFFLATSTTLVLLRLCENRSGLSGQEETDQGSRKLPTMVLFTAGALTLVGATAYYNYFHKRRGLPPGPTPVPLLGNVPQLTANPPGVDVFFEWREKYGPVFTYWLGEKPIVAFCDYDTINETLIKDGDNWSGRDFFKEFYCNLKSCKEQGIVGIEGPVWKEHRAFIMKSFKGLGMSKSVAEQKVCTELESMFTNLDKEMKASVFPHNMAPHVDLVIGGMANIFLFGYSFGGNHSSNFGELRKRINNYMQACYGPASMIVMSHPNPWKYFPYFKQTYDYIDQEVGAMLEYLDGQIKEHQKEMEKNPEGMDDFVTAFLKEIEKRNGQDGFTLPMLRVHLLDLWIAAQETTANTVLWGIAFSVHFPDKQKKMQEELDKVVGSNRMITSADKPNLPYTQAYCNEIQRFANIMPQGICRRNHRRTTVKGFVLEPGTAVMGLFSNVLYDPKIFPEPLIFKPERFLDEEGKLKKCDELIPFSAGRRICAGEALARMEIFMIIANLHNRYEVSQGIGESMPSLKRNFGFSIAPEPYKVDLSHRHRN